MRYIRRKSSIKLDESSGNIVDTLNVEDKVRNAPSINLLQQMAGIPTEGIIAYETEDGTIPEGYEEVDSSLISSGVEVGTIVEWDDSEPIPEGYDIVVDDNSLDIEWTSIVSSVQKNDAYVFDKVCHINGFITCSEAFEVRAWTIIGYVPEQYRPKTAQWFPASLMQNDYEAPQAMFVRIAPDGSINVFTKAANYKLVVFSAEWRITD